MVGGPLTVDGILLALLVGSIAFVAGISKDILWSGLKKLFVSESDSNAFARKTPPKNMDSCKGCLCLDRIKQCETCGISMKKDSVGFNKDIEHIKERLDRNDHEAEETRAAIRSIDKSLSRLVTIVEERTTQSGLSPIRGGT